MHHTRGTDSLVHEDVVDVVAEKASDVEAAPKERHQLMNRRQHSCVMKQMHVQNRAARRSQLLLPHTSLPPVDRIALPNENSGMPRMAPGQAARF